MLERDTRNLDVSERKKIGGFELQPTSLPGISLQVEEGVEIKMSRLDIEKFHILASAFTTADFGIKDLDVGKKESRPGLIQIAKSHEGLRGLVSELEGYRVTITEKHKKTWNLEVLQDSLGILYPAIVSEDYVARINIPQGARTATGKAIDKEKIHEAIRKALGRMGLDDKDIDAILSKTVSLRVDEKALETAIEEKRASIPLEASSEDITWEVRALPLQQGS